MTKLERLMQQCNLYQCDDGIYSAELPKTMMQFDEIKLREKIAQDTAENDFEIIAKHHSITVMRKEVIRFLNKLPPSAIILDIGGCWGWHWRDLNRVRPDVSIVILDFSRSNLIHAKKSLRCQSKQVIFLHADATKLPFPSLQEGFDGFDGIWSVQAMQHISEYKAVYKKINDILKYQGWFINYSLHKTPLCALIYRLLRKDYHLEGQFKNLYYLIRANEKQKNELENIFQSNVTERYTECLFHPDLKLTFSGGISSFCGRLDARLSNTWISRWIARQRNFEIQKSNYSVLCE